MNKRQRKKVLVRKIERELGVKIKYSHGIFDLYSSEPWKELFCVCGVYRKHRFVVVSYNGHPNAYVEAANPYRFDINYSDNNDEGIYINCHGGISFSGTRQYRHGGKTTTFKGIGWDYSHWGDFCPYSNWSSGTTRYKINEICSECVDVINQIIKGE